MIIITDANLTYTATCEELGTNYEISQNVVSSETSGTVVFDSLSNSSQFRCSISVLGKIANSSAAIYPLADMVPVAYLNNLFLLLLLLLLI